MTSGVRGTHTPKTRNPSSQLEYYRKKSLYKKGLIPYWHDLVTPDEAVRRAGL